MPLPLIPIAIVGGAAMLAGMGIEKGFDKIFPDDAGVGSKKTSIGSTHYEPYSHYSPTTTDMRQIQLPDYQIMVDSPFSRQDLTKKQTQEPDIDAGVTSEAGADLVPLVLIGAVGLIAYGVVKK